MGTIVFLPAAEISYIFYKTRNPNQANGVRSRGKRQIRFEIAGVKSQSWKTGGKITIRLLDRGRNTITPSFNYSIFHILFNISLVSLLKWWCPLFLVLCYNKKFAWLLVVCLEDDMVRCFESDAHPYVSMPFVPCAACIKLHRAVSPGYAFPVLMNFFAVLPWHICSNRWVGSDHSAARAWSWCSGCISWIHLLLRRTFAWRVASIGEG
jgi:hypothetical protein